MSFAQTQEQQPKPEPPAISPKDSSRILYRRSEEKDLLYLDEEQSCPTGSESREDTFSEQECTRILTSCNTRRHVVHIAEAITCDNYSSRTVWQTPASDYDCHPSESLQTTYHSQAFYRYHASKHLPLSPASTVSDRSDQSEQSSTSDVSSQSSQSSQSEQADSRGSLPDGSSVSQQKQHDGGAKSRSSHPAYPVTSLLTAEVHASSRKQPGCIFDGSTTSVKPRSGTSNDETRTCPSNAADRGDAPRNETAHLAYRSRSDTSQCGYPIADCGVSSTETRVQSRQEQTSPTVEPSCSEGPTGEASSQCFVSSLLKSLSGTTSKPASTGSPHNLQANSRRRPMASAVPPPKLRRDTDNTDAIVKMIVIFCTNLIQSIWPVDSASTASNCSPTSQSTGGVLPLQVFITETLRRSKTSYSTLQIALYYLILLRQCLPELTQPGQKGQSGCRAMLCGRRMFLTALILASKYLQDRNYSARAWSKISGLPMREINDNERRYLRFVGWDLHVPKEAFENWSKIVLAICRLSTGQDPATKDFDNHPPGPSAGPTAQTTRRSQLQEMCPTEQLHIVRSWWIFNLHGLCTDVVRCPQKTDRYVLSIPHLQNAPAITRPLFENKASHHSFDDSPEQDAPPSVQKLSRPSSMECLDRVQLPVNNTHPSASSKIMPPPPPMLGTLPTPQTTPRFDVTSAWKPSSSRSNSRCRDSASLLRSVDRSCPMASIEKYPASRCALLPPSGGLQECKSFSSQPSPGIWSNQSYRVRQFPQVSDRSLTSSPESVMSDLSSLSGFVGRSRTSSFSSTSSRSTMSQLSLMTSDPETCEGFKRQLNSLDAQIAPRVQDWTKTTLQTESGRPVPQELKRPQTAFRTSIFNPGCFEVPRKVPTNNDAELIIDEGYCSGDHAREKKEERRKQTTVQASLDMRVQQNLPHAVIASANKDNFKPTLSRPALTRSNTQLYMPVKQTDDSSQHTLKRSRSESFDFTAEPCLADAINTSSFMPKKDVQQSWQPWAAPKQPVQCTAQDTNKRIAVQSAAVTRTNMNLRKEACDWFNYHHRTYNHGQETSVGEAAVNHSVWQQYKPVLQEIQI